MKSKENQINAGNEQFKKPLKNSVNNLTNRMDHIENRDSWMIGKRRGIDSLSKGQWEILKHVWIE